MEALYFYETEDVISLIRFYDNGTVIKTSVATPTIETIPKILKWFNPKHKTISKGVYTQRGIFINFEVSRSKNEVVVCTGTFLDNNDKLNLYTHSHINDFKAERVYSLYKS